MRAARVAVSSDDPQDGKSELQRELMVPRLSDVLLPELLGIVVQLLIVALFLVAMGGQW